MQLWFLNILCVWLVESTDVEPTDVEGWLNTCNVFLICVYEWALNSFKVRD